MLRVAAFTGGRDVPSARFRIRQYIAELVELGISIHEYSRFYGSYPPRQRWLRPFWAVATLLESLPHCLISHKYDLVILQRELISKYFTIEPLTGSPRVLDVDDAIFMYRGGASARKLACLADLIICGNNFLADWFNTWNKNVAIIPTAVDTNRYFPAVRKRSEINSKVIGWIGTSTNLRYVYSIEKALKKVMDLYPNVRLRFVCNQRPSFHWLDKSRVDFLKWTAVDEVTSIQGMDIGIMPLADSLWEQGKCSYKMLQYMSCALPVVVSPVGMNADLLSMGNLGIGAKTENDWIDGLVTLLNNDDLCCRMGSSGRQIVNTTFSIRALAPKLASCLKRLC